MGLYTKQYKKQISKVDNEVYIMNTVNLVGRMTKNPEFTDGDTPRVRFSLAVPRRFSKNDDVDFISCVAFGKTAEFIRQYFEKGLQY